MAKDLYGLKALGDLPLYIIGEYGSMQGAEFVGTIDPLAEALPDALFILDPLYAYHPTDVDVQDHYARGRMFAKLGALFPRPRP